ncbi:hypothetical protein IJT10_02295, partial [bacterium]|nr:hypothetical protein [bacterium]
MCNNFEEKLEILQKYVLNYQFENRELLKSALTHRSYVSDQRLMRDNTVNDHRTLYDEAKSYEFLEFLGDAVLSFWARQYLYKFYNDEKGIGVMDEIKREAIKNSTLHSLANENLVYTEGVHVHRLGYFLRLGKSEMSVCAKGDYDNERILANVVEAIIGAICLDGGYEVGREGFNKAGEFVLNTLKLKDFIDDFVKRKSKVEVSEGRSPESNTRETLPVNRDSKCLLQKIFHFLFKKDPDYNTSETRPFRASLKLRGEETEFTGEGSTKKEAEQEVARKFLTSQYLRDLLNERIESGKGRDKAEKILREIDSLI